MWNISWETRRFRDAAPRCPNSHLKIGTLHPHGRGCRGIFKQKDRRSLPDPNFPISGYPGWSLVLLILFAHRFVMKSKNRLCVRMWEFCRAWSAFLCVASFRCLVFERMLLVSNADYARTTRGLRADHTRGRCLCGVLRARTRFRVSCARGHAMRVFCVFSACDSACFPRVPRVYICHSNGRILTCVFGRFNLFDAALTVVRYYIRAKSYADAENSTGKIRGLT